MRTAAELGFDDSRYSEIPDDIRELDPVGRSLMREERRAALESQNGGEAAPLPGPQPAYTEAFDAPQSAPQTGYDNGRSGFPEQQPASYDQQTSYEEAQQAPYEEQRQPAYEEPKRPAYDEPYFAQNGGLPQNDTFSPNGGYPGPSYTERVQEEPAPAQAAAPG